MTSFVTLIGRRFRFQNKFSFRFAIHVMVNVIVCAILLQLLGCSGCVFHFHFSVGCVSGDYSDIFAMIQPVRCCIKFAFACTLKMYNGHQHKLLSFSPLTRDQFDLFALFTSILLVQSPCTPRQHYLHFRLDFD